MRAPLNCNPRHAFSFFLVAALGFLPVHSGLAAPRDEIQHAIAAGGAASVEAATTAQFLMAFTSVAVRGNKQTLIENVVAGIKLRADLAPEITVAALRVQKNKRDFRDGPGACHWVDSITRAALAAAPLAKAAIVHTALDAEPTARECIFAAAEISDFAAFFCPPGVEAGNINSSTTGTINPGNFSGQGAVVSPFQP
jgi:hypothetical protein